MERLKEYINKIADYNHILTLMYWDMETQMPKEGFENRLRAITRFSDELFALQTAKELKEILDELSSPKAYDELDETWQFIVKKMKQDYEENARIPAEFNTKYVEESNISGQAWKEAKQKNDFSIFAPHLEKMIALTKERAAYTNPGEDVYDVLLDDYEKGMTKEIYDRLFEELKAGLLPMFPKMVERYQSIPNQIQGRFDVDAQRKVQKLLLEYIGFDFHKGTVGETEHPFTLNFSSKDVRVTNHYYEDLITSSIYSAIHEGGHAIFEQNVRPEYDGTVAGSCDNMGIHESQSRFYENVLGRNMNFWIPIYDKVQEILPELKSVSLEEFIVEAQRVQADFIRTEADEVSYCFHIILRYEMEKAIFCDGVEVKDLPELWKQKMKEYLGVVPETDAEGILQDMHWSDGGFGYFPSYLLGSIYDGMYVEAMEEELGSIDELLKNGKILEITKWLNEKIHQYGNTKEPKDIIEDVCHKEVSAQPLLHYFEKRYVR